MLGVCECSPSSGHASHSASFTKLRSPADLCQDLEQPQVGEILYFPSSGFGFQKLLSEVAGVHVHPGDGGTPNGPQARIEDAAIGEAHPPGAALEETPDDVALAVAVKVADLNVDPRRARAPSRPQAIGERAAGGLGR